jgi:HEAT repeat protein
MNGSTNESLDHDLLELANDSPGIWEAAGARLMEKGAAALPILKRGLNDDRLGSVAHWRMLLVLRKLAREESIPLIRTVLRRALTRRDSSVINGAMEALAAFRTPEAVDELVALLDHADPDLVKHAAVLAGLAGGLRAAEPLLRLLRSQEASIRYAAARGLVQVDDPGVRTALELHLQNETDPEVRDLLLRSPGHE